MPREGKADESRYSMITFCQEMKQLVLVVWKGTLKRVGEKVFYD